MVPGNIDSNEARRWMSVRGYSLEAKCEDVPFSKRRVCFKPMDLLGVRSRPYDNDAADHFRCNSTLFRLSH